MKIITTDEQPTMSSLELVEFINAERKEASEFAFQTEYVELAHRSFMAKVPEVLGQGCAKFLADYQHPQNKQRYNIYRFPKREACLMAMSYSYSLQAKVFDRMTELESKVPTLALPDFSNPAEAARAWAAQYEARAALEVKVASDAPKVAFAEVIRAMDGVCHIGDFCKTMRIGRNRLFARMKADKILMENRMPYQKYIDKGYFSVIEQKPYTNSKGETHVTFTTMVTGAGQVFLAKRYANMIGPK